MEYQTLSTKEKLDYTRDLYRQTDWYGTKGSNTITYTFQFEGHDDGHILPFESVTVERTYLMSAKEIEQIWSDLAEQNSRWFVRKGMAVEYPNSAITQDDEF